MHLKTTYQRKTAFPAQSFFLLCSLPHTRTCPRPLAGSKGSPSRRWFSLHPLYERKGLRPPDASLWTVPDCVRWGETSQTQKEIQGLITSSFYWGHPYNTYFPNAKHSRRTVEPLATWTTSGNCTSIFGSYSPITPTKRNTQLFPTKESITPSATAN